MNLNLCDLNSLWTNATLTNQAKNISYYDQDYICLLTEVSGANSLFLDLNTTVNCFKSLGLLKINQPKPKEGIQNSLNINLSESINKIHSITIGPQSTLNINFITDHAMDINFLNAHIININGTQPTSNKTELNIFRGNSSAGFNLNRVIGNIKNYINQSGEISITDTKLKNSYMESYDFNIDHLSSLTDCDIRSHNTLFLKTNNILNTLCSGSSIEYIANKFDISLMAYSSVRINSNLINGGTIIGTGPNTSITITNSSLVTALRLEKIHSLSINSAQKCQVRGAYLPTGTFDISGNSDPENTIELTPSFVTNAPSVNLDGFINYGTINSNRVQLRNGINYGTIKGNAILIDKSSVFNYGIIQQES